MNAASSLDSPLAAPRAVAVGRSRWIRSLVLLAVVGLVLLVGLSVLAASLSLPSPFTVSVDGHELFSSSQVSHLPPAHQVVLAAVALVGLLAAAVVLPVALILGVVAILALVMVAVALPLLAVALVVGLVLSPLLLLGWVVWRVVAG